MPTLSVVVPVYNVEKYIQSCIESILDQDYQDFELILVNDGSSDKSGDICDAYASQDKRIRVVHKENAGVSIARNTGIDAARGEYLTFIDSDDTIEQGFFAHAVNSIKDKNFDLFISGLRMIQYDERGVPLSQTDYGIKDTQDFTVKELFDGLETLYPLICICGPCCKLFRTNIIRANSIYFDPKYNYGEDTLFNIAYMLNCRNVVFSKKIFYLYRRLNSESLYGRFHRDNYDVTCYVYGEMRKLMQNVGCDEDTRERFEIMYFNLLVGCIHQYYKNMNLTSFINRRELIKTISKDKVIRNVSVKRMHRSYNRLIYFLLKTKSATCLQVLFFIKYKL